MRTELDPFAVVPGKKGQWWHWVAYVKTDGAIDEESKQAGIYKIGHEYGVQATIFMFQGIPAFAHIAVTDVANQKHERLVMENLNMEGFDLYIGWLRLKVGGYALDLTFDYTGHGEPCLPLQHYPSETSEHFGYPRVPVRGSINGKPVSGVGCYDREVFDRLLKPGERFWVWGVAWLDDGTTDMMYYFMDENHMLTREHKYNMHCQNGACFFPRIKPRTTWPTGTHHVGYREMLCHVKTTTQNGRGFLEEVGWDGTPDL